MITASIPAVVTMVYDDADYLGIWLAYWRRQLPDEALHVIIDGPNDELEAMAAGTNVFVRTRPEPHEHMETERWQMIADYANGLLGRYRTVVYTDVDEILIADPRVGRVAELLEEGDAPQLHTRGIEILHRRDLEPAPIDLDRPILPQRQYYRATGRFSKPSIIRERVRWSRGGHMTDRRMVRVGRGLYNVHLRFYDADRFLERTRLRRAATVAPAWLDRLAYRRWRSSDAAAEELLSSFERMPRVPGRTLIFLEATGRMRLSLPKEADAEGFYAPKTRDSKVVQRLPKRFLDAF